MTDEDREEREGIDRLGFQLTMVESFGMSPKFWDIVAPGSDLDRDDQVTRPLQSSHLVAHCLAATVDHLQTARHIIDRDGTGNFTLPMNGLFPVLRSALESASLAIWLLQPEDHRERIRRSVAARWDEMLHDDRAVLAMTEAEPGDGPAERSFKAKGRRENSKQIRARKSELREIATKAGLSDENYVKGLPGYGAIVGAASSTLHFSAPMLRGMWHLISGLTHPSVSRAMTMHKVTEVSRRGDAVSALFTVRPERVAMALDAACLSHLHALALAAQRTGRPEVAWDPPDDFPVPPSFAKRYQDGAR